MISWTALHRETLLLVYCQGVISGLKFDDDERQEFSERPMRRRVVIRGHPQGAMKCTLALNSRVRETRMFVLRQPKRGEHGEASGCC